MIICTSDMGRKYDKIANQTELMISYGLYSSLNSTYNIKEALISIANRQKTAAIFINELF